MTGSAFAILSRAGPCGVGWLRRIYSFRKGEVWRGIAARFHFSGRLADDGKRFCDLIARGTLFIGWPRRITYIILNCASKRGVRDFTAGEAGG